MAEVANHGLILERTHAATTELASSDFRIEPSLGKVVVWVYSTRGGTLTLYRYGTDGTARAFQTATITANTETAVALQFRVARGKAGFAPADGTAGSTRIDLDSSK